MHYGVPSSFRQQAKLNRIHQWVLVKQWKLGTKEWPYSWWATFLVCLRGISQAVEGLKVTLVLRNCIFCGLRQLAQQLLFNSKCSTAHVATCPDHRKEGQHIRAKIAHATECPPVRLKPCMLPVSSNQQLVSLNPFTFTSGLTGPLQRVAAWWGWVGDWRQWSHKH